MAETDRSTVLPWSVPSPELGSARIIYRKCYGRSMCDLQAPSKGKSFPVLSLGYNRQLFRHYLCLKI